MTTAAMKPVSMTCTGQQHLEQVMVELLLRRDHETIASPPARLHTNLTAQVRLYSAILKTSLQAHLYCENCRNCCDAQMNGTLILRPSS